MDDLQCKVAIGAMLHDIGKVIVSSSDGRGHSRSGHAFLSDEIGIKDSDILEQVLYHHAGYLKGSGISKDSLAYVTYIADNIAAAADRREKDEIDTAGFNKSVPLATVFNILNDNHGEMTYAPSIMDRDGKINYPTDKEKVFDSAFYGTIEQGMRDALKDLAEKDRISVEYINSLLTVMETYLTYIPSSTYNAQQMDVSLFDHMKLTAALANCIFAWLQEEKIRDYREELFVNANRFYEKKVFYLYSMDVSGIQQFIYHQFGTEDVLKNLRARSFYLELMTENFVDTLLRAEGLSRANLIYSGGGHAYLLLPNTEKGREAAEEFSLSTNAWLQDTFGTDLFLGTGGAECSALDLENKPEGSYGELFRTVSRIISRSKSHRYTAGQIRVLNQGRKRDGKRECRICHRSDKLTEENLCSICSGLARLSGGILHQEKNFYLIRGSRGRKDQLPIYKDEYLEVADADKVHRMIAGDKDFITAYSKNKQYVGYEYVTNMWVADYSSAYTLEELVGKGSGIKRLGVIRADVDNLGNAFVRGFPQKYQTLSRAATFSRALSMFFKWHINGLLRNGGYSLEDGGNDIVTVSGCLGGAEESGTGPRNATVIYAGGDDLFIVGAWRDIIEFAVDLHRSLEEFSCGTLSISAGIGLFDEKYPISYIASQTGDLEDASKSMEGKNAVTLFSEKEQTYHWEGFIDEGNLSTSHRKPSLRQTYHWDEFIDEVLGEKFRLLYKFFSFSSETAERGKAFLYHILDLFRKADEKINLARLAYLLARLEPSKKKGDENAEAYRRLYQEFKQHLYDWQRDEKDRRQFITAIYIYAYLDRESYTD